MALYVRSFSVIMWGTTISNWTYKHTLHETGIAKTLVMVCTLHWTDTRAQQDGGKTTKLGESRLEAFRNTITHNIDI